MKTSCFVPLLLLLAAFGLSAQTAAEKAEMQQFTKDLMAAYAEEDLRALQDFYVADAVHTDLHGKTWYGWAETAACYQEQFEQFDPTLALNPVEITWSDREHTWVYEGKFERYTNTSKFDFEVPALGDYTFVMVQQGGRWKIAKSTLFRLEPWPLVPLSEKSY